MAHWLPDDSNEMGCFFSLLFGEFPPETQIYCSMRLVVVYWLLASPKKHPPYSHWLLPLYFLSNLEGKSASSPPLHCLPSPHYFPTTLVGLHPFPMPEGSREGSTAYKIICFSVLYKGVGVCWLAVPLITSASFQCCCKLLGQIPLAGVGFPHLAKNGFNLPFSAVFVSLT